jgi:hypothetical protein
MGSGDWSAEKRKTNKDARFELIREGLVVQEDPRVVVPVVEPILQLAYGLHCASDV